MTLKILFLLGVAASGLTEWVKKLLPTSFVEKKATMPIIAGLISALTALAYGLIMGFEWTMIGAAIAVVVALSQTCYSLLFKTFKAIYERLLSKVTNIDTDKIADEVADGIVEKVGDAVEGIGKK